MSKLLRRWVIGGLAAGCAALASVPAGAQEAKGDAPHPLVALVRASVDDPAQPFVMLVPIRAKAGQGAKVVEAFAPAIVETRKEAGCLDYLLVRSKAEPDTFLVVERWRSLADLEKHLAAPHIVKLLGTLGSATTEAPPAQILVPVAEPAGK